MGRPKIPNPKNKHIGIVTTEDKYRRFKALNLKGDRAIDALLYYLEKDNQKLQLDKISIISKIKKNDELIEDLEFEKLKLETQLKEVDEKIGLAESGLSLDVEKAIGVILQRYENQSTYNILEFMNANEQLLETQAYLCGLDSDKLFMLVFNSVEG